mmetsp:Transcript_32670/g.79269  ORF Transcript_32670/g.79269 Transcript_32670/m.79269 type:complete len:93 (-) Transcript_32670:5-283(-)
MESSERALPPAQRTSGWTRTPLCVEAQVLPLELDLSQVQMAAADTAAVAHSLRHHPKLPNASVGVMSIHPLQHTQAVSDEDRNDVQPAKWKR